MPIDRQTLLLMLSQNLTDTRLTLPEYTELNENDCGIIANILEQYPHITSIGWYSNIIPPLEKEASNKVYNLLEQNKKRSQLKKQTQPKGDFSMQSSSKKNKEIFYSSNEDNALKSNNLFFLENIQAKVSKIKIHIDSAINQGGDSEMDVPHDNSCLFWAVALNYLLPVRTNNTEFINRFCKLFGTDELQHSTPIQNLLTNYQPSVFNDKEFNRLVREVFRGRVVEYIASHRQEFEGFLEDNQNWDDYLNKMYDSNSWGGQIEIAASSALLQCHIQVSGHSQSIYGQEFQSQASINLIHVVGKEDMHYHYQISKSYLPKITTQSEIPRDKKLPQQKCNPNIVNSSSFDNSSKKENIESQKATQENLQPQVNYNVEPSSMGNNNLPDNIFEYAEQFLHMVYLGNINAVMEFTLNMPQLINYKSQYGKTALHIAAYKGYKAIVEYLLSIGAGIDVLDGNNMSTPMLISAQLKNYEAITGHLKSYTHIKPNHTQDELNGRFTIHYINYFFDAVIRGDINTVKIFVTNTPEIINAQGNYGETALHLSVSSGHANIVEYLLCNQASPCIADIYNRTPVDISTYSLNSFYEINNILIDRENFNIRLVNEHEQQPLEHRNKIKSFIETVEDIAQSIPKDFEVTDPFAIYIATLSESPSSKPKETLLMNYAIVQAIKRTFPEKAKLLELPKNCNQEAIEKSLNNFISSFDWQFISSAIKDVIKQNLPQFMGYFHLFKQMFFEKPWLASLSENELLQLDEDITPSNLKIFEKIYEMARPYFDKAQSETSKMQLVLLQEKNKKYKKDFKTMDELHKYEKRLSLDKLVHTITNSSLRQNIHLIHEEFSRNYSWGSFYEAVIDELSTGNTNYNSQILQLFNSLIIDFISQEQSGLWLHNANNNFQHNYLEPDILSKIFRNDSKIKLYADKVISTLEHLLNDIEIIFLKLANKHPDSLISSTRYGHILNPQQEMLRLTILWHYERKLIEKFIQGEHHYGNNYPLVNEIKMRWKEYKKPHDKRRYRELPIAILFDIHLYPFTLERRIYEEADITQASYNSSLKYRKRIKPYLQSTIYSAIVLDIKKEIKPFLDFITLLIKSRQEDLEGAELVLGLGFAGPYFNTSEIDQKKNKLFLAFSKSGNTEHHLLFLEKLRSRLCYRESWEINIYPIVPDIEILHEEKRLRSNSSGLFDGEYPQPQHNRLLYMHTMRIILQELLLNSSNQLHESVKSTWLNLISTLIDEKLTAVKSKKNEFQKWVELKKKFKSLPLQNEDYQLIEKLIEEHHTFSCAETLLSRYGHTNLYVPITFRPKHKEHLHIDKNPIYVGNYLGINLTQNKQDNSKIEVQINEQRITIPPCNRCQLLSSAYMICSELTTERGVNELDKIAELTGKPEVPVRWFSNTTSQYRPDIFGQGVSANNSKQQNQSEHYMEEEKDEIKQNNCQLL